MFQQNNLTANKKCEFNKTTIRFYGLVFSENGVSPDLEKIHALTSGQPPRKASCGHYWEWSASIPILSKHSRNLLMVYVNFLTKIQSGSGRMHEMSFNRIIEMLGEDTMLSYFNPVWNTEVVCDGSPCGVSGIIS